MEKKDEKKIVDFCNSVKNGLGTMVDRIVKVEFERINELQLTPESLATLLALLEKHNLLDKKHSVNPELNFYQEMYKNMKKK